MSKKIVMTCPGSGSSASVTFGTSNPKVNCPRCQKRIGVHHGNKVRKHTALVTK